MSRGEKHNQAGLQFYQDWELEKGIAAFQKAAAAEPDNAEYHLNLARAFARSSNFHEAIQALGEYLRTETDPHLSSRFERLFSSALDEVESALIEGMRQLDLSIQYTGKAIQMWLEYRITIGRRPLRVTKPELWAAALAYTVVKVNFLQVTLKSVADAFQISERSLKERFGDLVQALDLMPADYFIVSIF